MRSQRALRKAAAAYLNYITNPITYILYIIYYIRPLEKIEYLLGRTPKTERRPAFEKYPMEHEILAAVPSSWVLTDSFI